MQTTLTHIIMK